MVALPSRTFDDDWSAEILEDAIGEMKAKVSVVKPGTPGTYDPITDGTTGGTPDTTLIAVGRRARVQHIRRPIRVISGDETLGDRDYLIQIEILSGDPLITQGDVVYVSDGGKDKSLENYAFVVITATNSSSAALRSLQCVSDLKPVT